MSKGHNKKRNTGLMYEFLVRSISKCLIEGRQKSSSKTLKLIRRHFKPGTELYKEFRLINSLIKTTVTSDGVANSIIQEAKESARSYDLKVLNYEKSRLINDVNHNIKDQHFYDQQITEYKMYATIQQLLNDWRNPNKDLERQAKFEDQLVSWLLSEKTKSSDTVISNESNGTSRLLMKVMMQKLNEKYSSILNEKQKELIRSYAWSTASEDNQETIKEKLYEIKDSLLKSIDSYLNEAPEGDEYTVNQLNEAHDQLLNETLEGDITDDVLTKFMLYLKLNDELINEDKNV